MSVNTRTSRFMPVMGIIVFGLAVVASGCSDDKSNGSADNPRFDPALVTIVIGDTIKWTAVEGDHTVTSGTGSNDPNSGNLFDEEINQGDSYTRVFSTLGTFDYYCIPHEGDGMKGKVIVAASDVDTVNISASGTDFSPADVQITVGDAVRWSITGSHTVTSGTGLLDPNIGDLFDEELSTSQSFVFTFNSEGVYPFFCRFHVGMGMSGTVTVVEDTRQTVEIDATM